MVRVLANLIDNARVHGGGASRVSVEHVKGNGHGDTVQIAVEDSGAGCAVRGAHADLRTVRPRREQRTPRHGRWRRPRPCARRRACAPARRPGVGRRPARRSARRPVRHRAAARVDVIVGRKDRKESARPARSERPSDSTPPAPLRSSCSWFASSPWAVECRTTPRRVTSRPATSRSISSPRPRRPTRRPRAATRARCSWSAPNGSRRSGASSHRATTPSSRSRRCCRDRHRPTRPRKASALRSRAARACLPRT